VPLLVIIFLAGFAFFYIRRHRLGSRVSREADLRDSHGDYTEHRAELPGNRPCVKGGQKYEGKPELDNSVQIHPIAELEQHKCDIFSTGRTPKWRTA
jgi:hypothetical protein